MQCRPSSGSTTQGEQNLSRTPTRMEAEGTGGGKKAREEAPFSDEQLAAIAGVVQGLLDKALTKRSDGSGPSKEADGVGPRAGELGLGEYLDGGDSC